MATAITGYINVQYQNGASEQYPYTGSDVTTQYLLFQDGTSQLSTKTQNGGCRLTDVVVSATGDTSQIVVYQNAKPTGATIYKSVNLPTTIGRQLQNNPLGWFQPGTRFTFQQIT